MAAHTFAQPLQDGCSWRRGMGGRRAACAAAQLSCRGGFASAPRASRVRCSAHPEVDVERAKVLMEREGYKFLDIRSAREYDDSHITKPARTSFNVPLGPTFITKVTSLFPSTVTKLIVACTDGGSASDEALAALASAQYGSALKLQGGYAAWTQTWTPSGKRRPPPGRWVSSGKEALKSGLNIPGVAESYDEGGNDARSRWAKGLQPGQDLPRS